MATQNRPYYDAILENANILKQNVSKIADNFVLELVARNIITPSQRRELMALAKDPDLFCDKLLDILGSNLNDQDSWDTIIALKESGSTDLANTILETYQKSQGELYYSSFVSPGKLASILVQFEGVVRQWVAFADFLQVQQSTLFEIQSMSIHTPAAERFRILLKEYVESQRKSVPLVKICHILKSLNLSQNEAADKINRMYPNGWLVANSEDNQIPGGSRKFKALKEPQNWNDNVIRSSKDSVSDYDLE